MWCTQGFAKDDTIGRVRWGCKPQVAGMQCPGRWEAVPSPFTFSARLVVSMALFPTCLGTWSLGTLPATVGCHLQTMPTCSVVSGPWPKRVSTGWVVTPSGSRGKEKTEGSDVWPAPAVHNSLSSVLVALITERDRLRDLHQGSELSRMAVSSGTWQLTGGRA